MNAISSSVNKGAVKVAPKAAIRRPRRPSDKSTESSPALQPVSGPVKETSLRSAPVEAASDNQETSKAWKPSVNAIPVVSSSSAKRRLSSSAHGKSSEQPIKSPSVRDRSSRSASATLPASTISLASASDDIDHDDDRDIVQSLSAKTFKESDTPAPDAGDLDAGEDQDSKMKRRRRASARRKTREPTPETAEEEIIDTTGTRMLDLCKDLRKGRKSTRYEQFKQITAAKRRQKRQQQIVATGAGDTQDPDEAVGNTAEALADHAEEKPDEEEEDAEEAEDLPDVKTGAPQVRVVNGQIVLDVASLQVDRAARDAAADTGPIEYVEENPLTRTVNSNTHSKRIISMRWDASNTDLFYRGLSQWGTDFDMISRMFPGRNRKQIKSKFTIEERRNPTLVNKALMNKVPVDLDEYSKMSEVDYRSVNQLESELAELKAQFEVEREEAVKEAEQRRLEAQSEETMQIVPEEAKKKSRKRMADDGVEVVGTIDEVEAEERRAEAERARHVSDEEAN